MHWRASSPSAEIAHHPVVNVFWQDAQAYAAWLGMRLPTEAEWEKAARGTDGRLYPWGNHGPTTNLCNFGMNVGRTTPVGQYSPQGDSLYGCQDMSGNVWEWTDSWYDDYKRYRVVRGGGYRYRDRDICVYRRHNLFPTFSYNDVGFRLVST